MAELHPLSATAPCSLSARRKLYASPTLYLLWMAKLVSCSPELLSPMWNNSGECCLLPHVSASGKGSPLKCWVTSHNLFLSNWPGKYALRFQRRRNTKYFLIKLGIICLAGITAVRYFSIVLNQTLSSALPAHSNNNGSVFNVWLCKRFISSELLIGTLRCFEGTQQFGCLAH